MKLLLIILLTLVPIIGFGQKPTPEDEKAVLETEYAWCQAYLKADTAALAEIEIDGYTLTNPSGSRVTKEQEIAELKSGVIHFIELSSHELSVHVYGDTAIVTGRTVLKAIEDNEPHNGVFQFTDTFVRQNGHWRAAAEQVTRLTETANSSTEPLPRDQALVQRHDSFVEIAKKGGIDVLFLGDSITDFWRNPEKGLPVWEKNFGALHAANFGISGDRTQHVLWRMKNGELTGYKPRAVVLMIGTNNTGFESDKLTPRNSTEEVISGVTAIVQGLTNQWPDVKVLLFAIFPRAEKPTDPIRQQIRDINTALARLHDGRHIFFLDIGQRFLAPDGTLAKEVMPDFLHPSTRGYEIWAEAIQQPLADLLK